MTLEEQEGRVRKAKVNRWLSYAFLATVVLIAIAWSVWVHFFRAEEVKYASTEEQFKYGSIGTEWKEGIPYWIWLVLPRVFHQHLPATGGYVSFGFIWEEGKETPIGFSRKIIGFPRLGVNCALCHVGTWRASADDDPKLLIGAPSHQVDIQAYQQFLFKSANDPRFTPEVLMPEIEKVVPLSPLEKIIYRNVLIPQTRKALIQQQAVYAFFEKNPRQGHGRIDPFNPVKYRLLGIEEDGSIGNADMQSIWNAKARQGMALHWDGLNTSYREVVLSSAIGDGSTEKSIAMDDVLRLEGWLMELSPPAYPKPINDQLVIKGKVIFQTQCSTCHAEGGDRLGQVIPVAEVKTDGHRLGMWRENAANAYNNYIQNDAWKFQHFRATDGYVASLLDGVWARAPYLHNGSVPSLYDLLQAPERRPQRFWRGSDIYDFRKVGFHSLIPTTDQLGFLYDTGVRGNGNEGHAYGTHLPEQDKIALIEYLKTL
jgi:mono/diheme cytochrome c family protein